MPAPKGNQYGAKPDEDKLSSRIWINVTPGEKGECVNAAGGQKLTEWGREKLLEAAREDTDKDGE